MVVAAPLHDIGKIHIPDAVLNKPGKLTEEEFGIMKTHTTAGEELLTHAKAELGESGYLNTAVEMAAYHHEWWNGKGYPYGISGEEIPLCARIMAVADVFVYNIFCSFLIKKHPQWSKSNRYAELEAWIFI